MASRKFRIEKKQIASPKIGLGTWSIAGSGWKYSWGEQAPQDSLETIALALERGIKVFDTAPSYGKGKAELTLGQALKNCRDKVRLSSKCGLSWKENKLGINLDPNFLRAEVEQSLKNMQTDCIDFVSIHYPGKEQDNIRAWETLLELREEGKVRFIGVSNFSSKQVKALTSLETPSFIQKEFNLVSKPEKNELAWLVSEGIKLFSYSPLLNGILTDKFCSSWFDSLSTQDWRKQYSNLLNEKRRPAVYRYSANLKKLAEDSGVKLQHLALRWTLQRSNSDTVLIGARSPNQLEDLLESSAIQLSEDLLKQLNHHTSTLKSELRSLRG